MCALQTTRPPLGAQVDVRRKAPKKGKAAIAAFHQYDPLNYSTAPPPLFSFSTTKDSVRR